MDDNLLIISHRRSGTHLTIDSIRNNFDCFRSQPLLTLETLQTAHGEHQTPDEFQSELACRPRIIKTHYLPRFNDLLPDANSQRLVNFVYRNSKKIYVVRNGLDVLVSLYEFRKSHNKRFEEYSFGEFIRLPTFDPEHKDLNKVEYWCRHVTDWLGSDYQDQLLMVSFEDWILNYEQTLDRIAGFLELNRDRRTTDVRIGSGQSGAATNTTVAGRKGKIGDWSNYFAAADLQLFSDNAGQLSKELGYDLSPFSQASS
ncbi:MAG: sulfotransferase domain-containing protein [Planctomycetota bacterium]